MKFAIIDGERQPATPRGLGLCPCCGGEVIAKCGEVVSWHWSHRVADCDPWWEPESAWHVAWKRRFPDEWQEITVGCHRADVKTPNTVIEFQASQIAPAEIRRREEHYVDMVWLVKAGPFRRNLDIRPRGGFDTFVWKHPRKSWFGASKTVAFDFEDGRVFVIKKLHPPKPHRYEIARDGDGTATLNRPDGERIKVWEIPASPCAGWGVFISPSDFVRMCQP